MTTPRPPYGEDLAFVHDVGFGGFARHAASGVLGILAAAGVRSGRVVDLGCGSGIWAERLYRRSDETHRLRLYAAPDVLRGLRRAGLHARVVRSYGAFRLPRARAGFVARKRA